ncbi:MAG: ribosomal protein L13e [Sulfolobales archaeon]|nr:ribosomal protein L13e [Sulfolobales archaeon]MCX8208220.1 ribosomal protein L13e [Sulfolobales archaeon]MDW8011230.1 ribosomal protein L13e [Sulfolobales archaeon]
MKARPYVKPPALIKDRGLVKNLRVGRGFSICELEKAGLDPETAKSLKIYVDTRRKTCYEWNVKILQELLSKLSSSKSTQT